MTVYLDELKNRLVFKGEASASVTGAAAAAASGSECKCAFDARRDDVCVALAEPQMVATTTHERQHPAEYISRDVFVNAGFAFVAEDPKKAYQV